METNLIHSVRSHFGPIQLIVHCSCVHRKHSIASSTTPRQIGANGEKKKFHLLTAQFLISFFVMFQQKRHESVPHVFSSSLLSSSTFRTNARVGHRSIT